MHDSANCLAEPLSREIVLTRSAQADSSVTGSPVIGSPIVGSILWLHGLGADGNDFVPMVPAMQKCQSLPLRFIFPHAPVRAVTINGGMQMRAWYDIRGIDLTGERLLDNDGIEQSIAQIQQLIELENQQGIANEQIIVAGFSQGGVIALQTGLQMMEQIKGVIGLSCYLPNGDQLINQPEPSKRLPAFIGHGTQDPMVPFALGQRAAEQVGQRHFQVTWGEYPVAHGVHPEEIAAVDNWIYNLMR